MADQATERIVVKATPERVWEVLTDFTSYPDWANGLKAVRVVDRDPEGRDRQVEFRAAAMGRSTTYTLEYDYSAAPQTLSWKLVDSDVTRALDGSYELIPEADGPGSTEVVYKLTVDLRKPLPGFVKRRAEGLIIHTALDELRNYLER